MGRSLRYHTVSFEGESSLAHSRSALKRWRQNLRRRARNKAVRSATRTFVKKAIAAIEQAAPNVMEALREAQSALDRAAKKGVIHPNAAARRKSRLMRRLHAMEARQAA
ncbi:MAG TPA: 30S ribosomal protein S20, partial [Dehalococcoidia bacterium]|nr:30S ribosomal protein S20 [Dehalococcoidia bacterium]